jgi:transcriptional regulator with XRE-family HTH domain
MTKAEKKTLLGQVRAAITASDLTMYRIAKESGVDPASLSRFMSGERGLSVESLELLAIVLRLRIVTEKKGGRR